VHSDPALRRAHDVPRIVGSHARATEHTGWRPARQLTATLRDVLEDWRARIAAGGGPAARSAGERGVGARGARDGAGGASPPFTGFGGCRICLLLGKPARMLLESPGAPPPPARAALCR